MEMSCRWRSSKPFFLFPSQLRSSVCQMSLLGYYSVENRQVFLFFFHLESQVHHPPLFFHLRRYRLSVIIFDFSKSKIRFSSVMTVIYYSGQDSSELRGDDMSNNLHLNITGNCRGTETELFQWAQLATDMEDLRRWTNFLGQVFSNGKEIELFFSICARRMETKGCRTRRLNKITLRIFLFFSSLSASARSQSKCIDVLDFVVWRDFGRKSFPKNSKWFEKNWIEEKSSS